jgi:hypothetical protein
MGRISRCPKVRVAIVFDIAMYGPAAEPALHRLLLNEVAVGARQWFTLRKS